MSKIKNKLNEGDYTEYLLNNEPSEKRVNTQIQKEIESEDTREYNKRKFKNTQRGLPQSFKNYVLKDCDRFFQISENYYLIEWAGKWNVVSSQKEIVFPQWFDKVLYKDIKNGNLNPIRVKLYNYWNYINPQDGTLLSKKWFDEVRPFNDGWAEVYLTPEDDECLWVNTKGQLFHDDNTPYEEIKTQNESKNMNKKNTIRLTESQLKKVISESVKKILTESDRLGWSDDVWGMFEELKEGLGAERLCSAIAGKLDEKTLQMILKRIYMEYDFNDDEEEF